MVLGISSQQPREEFALKASILELAQDENIITTEILNVKTALKTSDTRLRPKAEKLLEQIKQPWEIVLMPKKRNIHRRFRSEKSGKQYFKKINHVLQAIDVFCAELPENHENSQEIKKSLHKIMTVYEDFKQTFHGADPNERETMLGGRVELYGIELGHRFLNPEAVNKLQRFIDGDIIDPGFGGYCEATINDVCLKRYPFAPGIEKAVYNFNQLVSVQGLPPRELVNITSLDYSFTSIASIASCRLESTFDKVIEYPTDGSLKNLKMNLSGKHIRAKGTKIIVDILKAMDITLLDLNENSIEDDGVSALASELIDTQIIQLGLRGNHITLDGVSALATGLKGTKVEELDLRGNRIGDEGVKALAKVLEYTNITHLNLSATGLGDIGVSAIVAVLEDTKITHLNLSFNLIKNEGANALGSILIKLNTKIKHLDLKQNQLRRDDYGVLQTVLKQYPHIEIELF